MLAYHLKLQLLRLHRMVRSMGGYPLLNYLVVAGLFAGLSLIMYIYLRYFSSSYILLAFFAILSRSSDIYNEFLQITYGKKDYYRIRLAENTLIALPFILVLCLTANFLPALILLGLAALMVFLKFRVKWQIAIPTPFSRYPFEFIIGFRVAFAVFLLAYYLTYVAIRYANPGIGIFALGGIGILCMMFYFVRVEDIFYVWIFSSPPGRFLRDKIGIAVLSTLLLCLPILVSIAAVFPQKIPLLLVFQILGLCFVTAGVVCKYSSYPGEIGARDGLLVFLCILLPPLLIFMIPYLYKRSIRQLKGILT